MQNIIVFQIVLKSFCGKKDAFDCAGIRARFFRQLYHQNCKIIFFINIPKIEGGIDTIHIATMSLEVHTTFCVQTGGKSRIACERVVSRWQSSVGRYEHFDR